MRWWSAIALLRSHGVQPRRRRADPAQPFRPQRRGTAPRTPTPSPARASSTSTSTTPPKARTPHSAPTPRTTTAPTPAHTARLRALRRRGRGARGAKGDAKLKRPSRSSTPCVKDGLPPDRVLPLHPHRRIPRRAPHRRPRQVPPTARVEAVTGTLPPEERETRVNDLTDTRRTPGPGRHRLPVRRRQPAGRIHRRPALRPGLEPHPPRTTGRPRRPIRPGRAHRPRRHLLRRGQPDRRRRPGRPHPPPRSDQTQHRGLGARPGRLHHRHERDLGVPAAARHRTRTAAPSTSARHHQRAAADAVLTQWIDAAEREKASRSRFRQAGLRPDEVETALADVRRSLGGPADAERSCATP